MAASVRDDARAARGGLVAVGGLDRGSTGGGFPDEVRDREPSGRAGGVLNGGSVHRHQQIAARP
jgi:hypothetical protein